MNPLLPGNYSLAPAVASITTGLIAATDPAITYSGTDILEDSIYDPPKLTANYSALTYPFMGNGIAVVARTTGPSPGQRPTYNITCLIDGQEVAPTYPSYQASWQYSLYDMIICSTIDNIAGGLTDSPPKIIAPLDHTLILNLTWSSQDHIAPPLALSYIVVSDPPTNSDNAMYWATNSLVQTSLRESNFGWEMDSDLICWHTSTQGSQIILPFTGASATWYGFHKPDMRSQSGAAPPATYSVDNGDEVPFDTVTLPINGAPNATWLMQQLFETQTYIHGNHTLKVSYKANSTGTRLTLCSLLVQSSPPTNSTVPSSTAPSSSVVSSPPSTHAPQHHNQHGEIAGGIGGSVAALILLTAVAFFLGRYRRMVRREEDHHNNNDPVAQPFPPLTDQTTLYLGPRKERASQQNMGNPFMQVADIAPPVSKWTRRTPFSSGGVPGLEVSANNAEPQSLATSRSVAHAPAAQVPNQQQTHSRESPLSLGGATNHPIYPQVSQEVFVSGGGMRMVPGEDVETPISMPPPSYTS